MKNDLTEAELMEADVDKLPPDQIQRKIAIITLRKAERELALINEQNQEFIDKKAERKRVADAKTATMVANQQADLMRQSACSHKTGGMGIQGFTKGDGKIYGYCVATQVLPTAEVYFLCFRCQKEWRMPRKRAVLDGTITLEQYYAREAEYNVVKLWDKKTFTTPNGEIPGCILFKIPAYERQMQKDDDDFAAYLEKLKTGDRSREPQKAISA